MNGYAGIVRIVFELRFVTLSSVAPISRPRKCRCSYSETPSRPRIRCRTDCIASARSSPTMKVRTCSPTGPESPANDTINAASASGSRRRQRSRAHSKSSVFSSRIIAARPAADPRRILAKKYYRRILSAVWAAQELLRAFHGGLCLLLAPCPSACSLIALLLHVLSVNLPGVADKDEQLILCHTKAPSLSFHGSLKLPRRGN